MARVALKVHTANQQVLRVFMDDDVRQRFRFLQDANLGVPTRVSSIEVLSWGARQTPPWELLSALSTGATSILYIGQVT